MSARPPTWVVGNWKMHGLPADLQTLVSVDLELASRPTDVNVALCPPATLLARAHDDLGPAGLVLGAQDCHAQLEGPHTGDLSAQMLGNAGARLVIVGHSERRQDHFETSDLVARKAAAAQAAGLRPVICVGETIDQRMAGEAEAFVADQALASLPSRIDVGRTIVAYEPVWAIGTGLTPDAGQIEAMHTTLRAALVGRLGEQGEQISILYGGSVSGANAGAIVAIPEVAGCLVGGASLRARDFIQIIRAAEQFAAPASGSETI